jgi:hypothetical protein
MSKDKPHHEPKKPKKAKKAKAPLTTPTGVIPVLTHRPTSSPAR